MKKKFFSTPIVFILGLLLPVIGNTVNIYMITDYVSFDKEGEILIPMREAILSFITFGIYGIFWTYKTAKTVNYALSEEKKAFTATVTVLSAFALRFLSLTLLTNKILLSEKR